MKQLLLAGAAAILIGPAAYSGEHGNDHDHDANLRINGQTIEIRDGAVIIDGEVISTEDGVVIIEDGDVRVMQGGHGHHARHVQVHVDEDGEHHRYHYSTGDEDHVWVDSGNMYAMAFGAHEDAMDALRMAMDELEENLETGTYHDGSDWDDLSEEEKEEVREEIREAREEIREALSEMNIEMRDMEREHAEERRRIHIEMRDAERDMERSERDIEREMAHVEREVERAMAMAEREMARAGRDMARAERDMERAERHMRHERREDVRVEVDDDGRRRVWVNGEEQTGDDLTGWLNSIENQRLAGGMMSGERDEGEHHYRRRVVRLDSEDAETRIVQLEGGRRVLVVVDEDGETQIEIDND